MTNSDNDHMCKSDFDFVKNSIVMSDVDSSNSIVDNRTSDTVVKNIGDNLVLHNNVDVDSNNSVDLHSMKSDILVNKTVNDFGDSVIQEHSCNKSVVKKNLDHKSGNILVKKNSVNNRNKGDCSYTIYVH